MTKKIFLILSVVSALLICHSTVYAEVAQDIQRGASNIGNEIKDSWNKAGNSMQDAGNTVASGISNMGNDNKDNNNQGNNNNNPIMNDDNNNRYTAERTSAMGNDGSFLGMSSTTFTWIILAIVGIAIVALVWYYGMQQSNKNTHHD